MKFLIPFFLCALVALAQNKPITYTPAGIVQPKTGLVTSNWTVSTNLIIGANNFTNYLGRINVTTLGIVGDGATDNGALLTNAVARNQPLYFPPGTYLTSLPINTTGRLNISGAGSSSTGANVSSIVFTGYNTPIVTLNGEGNVVESLNLKYAYTQSSTNTASAAITFASNSYLNRISDVYIQDSAYGILQGVGVESWQNTLRNIYINGYSIGGIHLKGGGTTWGLRDIYVQNISGPTDYTETIVNVVRSSGTNLTITLSGAAPTLLTTNSFFVTSGLAPSAYNGAFVVTSIAGSVITASMASDPGVAPSDVVGVLQCARQFSTEQPVYLGGGYYSVNGLDVEHCVTGSSSFVYLGSAWVDIQDLHIEGAYSTNSTFSHIRSQSVAASLGTVSVINSGFIPGQTGYTLYNDGSGQTNILSVKSLSVRDVATNGATWTAALKGVGSTDAILGNWNGIGSLRANTAGYPQSWGDVYKPWGYDWDEGVTATLARDFSVTGTIQGSSTIKANGGIAAGGVSVSRDFTATAFGMQVRGDTGDALAITSVGNLTYIKSDAADGLPSLYMDGINNLWSFSSPARWTDTNGVTIVSTNLSVFGTNIFTIIANSAGGGGGGGGNVYHGSSSTNNYLTMFSGSTGTNIVQAQMSFVLGDGLYVDTAGSDNVYASAYWGVSLNLYNSGDHTKTILLYGTPTVDRTITLQDADGVLAFVSDIDDKYPNLFSEDANTLAERNGTTAQVFNLYGTYTDASNYERLKVTQQTYSSGDYFTLTAEEAGTGTDRQNIVIQPKGGSITAQMPDGTTTGGNARGVGAVDLQMARLAAGNVASGANAGLVSGDGNTASGQRSFIGGGAYNTVSQVDSSVLGGQGNAVSGIFAVVSGGAYNTASGSHSSVTGGGNSTASSDYAEASGASAVANKYGQRSRSSVSGGHQREEYTAFLATTDATASELRLDGTLASANRLALGNNETWGFTITVTGRTSTAGANVYNTVIQGCITKGTTAGSTAIVGTNVVLGTQNTAGAAAWVVTATADTTNGALAITVTGAAATNINWHADVRVNKVTKS